MPKLFHFFFALSVVVFFSGCASVSSTSAHYFALTPEIYPAKPKDAVIPILVDRPSEPHKAIGKFQWETPHSWRFIRKDLEYNARRNGADAVVLKSQDSYEETVLTDVPARMDMVPYTRYVYAPRGGRYNRDYQVVPIVNWIPVFRPGYVASNTTVWNVVDAEMVVFPGRTKPASQVPPLEAF